MVWYRSTLVTVAPVVNPMLIRTLSFGSHVRLVVLLLCVEMRGLYRLVLSVFLASVLVVGGLEGR